MQVALESHQGFIFACEGDPGVGQATQACTSVRFLFSCACVTQGLPFPPAKRSVISHFFSFFFCKNFCSLPTLPAKMFRRKTCNKKKVWQFYYQNCSSQQRWQSRCLMESGIPAVLCIPSCCVVFPPSLCLQTSSDLPCSSDSCLTFFGKKSTVFSVNMSTARCASACTYAKTRSGLIKATF